MNDLTNKTIQIEDTCYYVYSQLMYNLKYYILVTDKDENPLVYELINKDNKYHVKSKIDEDVIEKFIKILSIEVQ